jgi:nucleoside phosphorylase
MGSPADALLVTVNKHETQELLSVFQGATSHTATTVPIDDRVYRDLGTINGTKVFHALSEMGTSGLGGMQQTVDKAIRAVHPRAVIAVGIAFGVNKKQQKIGDVLLSRQLRLYELQRAGHDILLRGDKPHASTRLINFFEGAAQTTWKGATVRPGAMLSGDKLVDNIDYRDQLLGFEPEAVGGEMEGAGLYAACHDHRVDWIIIKAICDWADGQKAKNKSARQKKSCIERRRVFVACTATRTAESRWRR